MLAQVPRRSLRLNVLLDQQLWYLGQDIRHPDGNALVRFGFERLRSPGEGTTCYRLAMGGEPGVALLCWGFALYVGHHVADTAGCAAHPPRGPTPAGVMLLRHAASARLIWPSLCIPLHKPSELPRLDPPRTGLEQVQLSEGVARLARQLQHYETWTEQALGAAHRTRVLAALPRHKRRKFAPVTDLAPLWREVEARHTRP
jgi:hypothetical protein